MLRSLTSGHEFPKQYKPNFETKHVMDTATFDEYYDNLIQDSNTQWTQWKVAEWRQ